MHLNATRTPGAAGLCMLLLTAGLSCMQLHAQNYTTPLFIPDTLSTADHDTIDLYINETQAVLFPTSSPSNPPIPGFPWNNADTAHIHTMSYENPDIFNPGILGPTLIWYYGDSVTMRVQNNLMHESTTHWHGAHVAPGNDGGPHQVIQPNGGVWAPSFRIRDDVSTLWYHPHLHHHTLEQVQKGMAGMIYVRNPADPYAQSLPHEYGVNDFPLVIQDKFIRYDATSGHDTINTCCSMGTVFFVNGTWKPKLQVPESQWVRLRLLNGSSERTYCMFLRDSTAHTDLPFYVIASDAGYLESPYRMGTPPVQRHNLDSLLLMMGGERYEILFFADPGHEIYLVNRRDLMQAPAGTPFSDQLKSFAGGPSYDNPSCYSGTGGPGGAPFAPGQQFPYLVDSLCNAITSPIMMLPGPDFDSIPEYLMKFEAVPMAVGSPVLSVPTSFSAYQYPPDYQNPDTTRYKHLVLDLQNSPPFLIDFQPFAENIINDIVQLNATEKWTVFNTSGVAHPFHIHDIHFFLTACVNLAGDTLPILPYMQGPKDVFASMDSTEISFVTQFTDFATPPLPQNGYMYHCHILSHEDGGMMHQFVVVDPSVSRPEPAAAGAWNLIPNPAGEDVHLRGACDSPSRVQMTDLRGVIVREWNLPPLHTGAALELHDLPSGLYLVRWERDGVVSSRRLSIRH